MQTDKGSVIRTIMLIIALVNQIFGTSTIALNEAEVISIVDGVYLLVSTLFTVVMSVVTWYKNNYVFKKGKLQKKALERQGLK